MKYAIVGSRGIDIDIAKYMPSDMTVLVSGGAKGIDTLAERYADVNGIEKIIFKPDYKSFGSRAPLIRNKDIVNTADCVIAIWDGESRGTKYTIDYALSVGKQVKVIDIRDIV